MELKKFLSAPILLVFVLVGFVYHVTIFVLIKDWLGFHSLAGCVNALIFTFLALLCVFSFVVCVYTDPGGVPSAYVPDVEKSQDPHRQIKKSGAHTRHCDKCSAHKPPRAHHCLVCGKCVLRMDQHCVWINNCVGHRNYKSFLVLILYATLATIYSAIATICCILQKDWDFTGNLHLKKFYVAYGVIIVGLSLTLTSLLGWRIYLTARNMTTIEARKYYEGKRTAWLTSKSGMSYHHPFNVGAYKNITMVLGPDLLKWLWPTAISHVKDGLSFPTARDGTILSNEEYARNQ